MYVPLLQSTVFVFCTPGGKKDELLRHTPFSCDSNSFSAAFFAIFFALFEEVLSFTGSSGYDE
jgi:hypothetical protein